MSVTALLHRFLVMGTELIVNRSFQVAQCQSKGDSFAKEDEENVREAVAQAYAMVMVCVPNAFMIYKHFQGRTTVLVQWILRSPMGVYGLFALPPVGLALEKSFYDTAMSFQGVDPTRQKTNRKHEGFPAGGHALPSLSLIPVWKDSPLRRAQTQHKHPQPKP